MKKHIKYIMNITQLLPRRLNDDAKVKDKENL